MTSNRAVLLLPFALTAALTAQAGHVEVPPGREFQQHKVLTLGLTDTWEFEADEGEFLHCVVETGDFDPILELVDFEGERLGLDDGEGTRSELRNFAPKKGKYTFRVQGYEGRGGGNYRFWLQRYETERLPLGPMPVLSAAEHVFGPERWWHYRIAVKKGDVFVPRVPFGGRLTAVLDTDQRRLPEWHGGYTAQRDGDVLLRVEGQEKHRCRVDVQLARQRALPEDGALDAEMPEGSMDLYRHRFTPGAWTFELDSPNGDVVESLREIKPGKHPRFRLMGSSDKNGRLRQWYLVYKAMDAELVIRNHHGPRSYLGRCAPVHSPIGWGERVDAELPLGGNCLFELPTKPGQLLRVALTSEAFDGCFDLWMPNGAKQPFDDTRLCDTNPTYTFLTTMNGPYRVLVGSPSRAGSGLFTLQVDELPIPELAVGGGLEVRERGEASFAHLSLEAGQEVWLSLRSSSFDAALKVHGPDGRHLGTFEGGGTGGNVLTGFHAQHAGTYTLHVMSRNGGGEGTLRAIAP